MEVLVDPTTLEQLVESYKPDATASEFVRQADVVLIFGISGAGKGTIIGELVGDGTCEHVVSTTTRLPREDKGIREQDGREYFFRSREEVANMLAAHQFIEAKPYGGNVYGTSLAAVKQINDRGRTAIADVEVQGVQAYKKLKPDILVIAVLPRDFPTWHDRFLARYGGNEPRDYAKRVEAAVEELTYILESDTLHIVINDDLDVAVGQVRSIIQGRTEGQADITHVRQVASELRRNFILELAALNWQRHQAV